MGDGLEVVVVLGEELNAGLVVGILVVSLAIYSSQQDCFSFAFWDCTL